MTGLFVQEWGAGPPVIALAPLGLESSAFAGLGASLAARGMRTLAVDLPGFGKTPAPPGPLTPAVLAAPVIELARSLDPPPVVLGISLGGRVALEIALAAPQAVCAVVPVAPYLPWLHGRVLLEWARLIDPALADWLPLERLWPGLRWLAHGLETLPYLRDDPLARAGARLVYYMSCPATRSNFLSAARELALDPALGPAGLWTRLARLAVPAAFVWGERDQLVSLRFARPVARFCPQATQMLLPCVGHWVNGPHHRCLAATIAELAPELAQGSEEAPSMRHASGVDFVVRPCVVVDAAGTAPAVGLGRPSHA